LRGIVALFFSAAITFAAICLLAILITVAYMTFGNLGDGGGDLAAPFLFFSVLGLSAPGLLVAFGLTIVIYRKISPTPDKESGP
jgi:ABC-type Fe3+ transport system permease subunit